MVEINFVKSVEDSIKKNLVEHFNQKVGSMKCPEHGKYPKITCNSSSFQNLSFNVSGCCEKFVDTIKKKLNK